MDLTAALEACSIGKNDKLLHTGDDSILRCMRRFPWSSEIEGYVNNLGVPVEIASNTRWIGYALL